MPDIKLFAGNATPELAKHISERLYISLGDATVGVSVMVKSKFKSMKMCVVQMYSLYNQPVHQPMIT